MFDRDQTRPIVSPDLDQNCLTLLMVTLEDCFENFHYEFIAAVRCLEYELFIERKVFLSIKLKMQNLCNTAFWEQSFNS